MNTNWNLSLSPCECEHACHFDHKHRSPNGNPGHLYGVRFSFELLKEIATDYGHWNVCPDCAKDCHA